MTIDNAFMQWFKWFCGEMKIIFSPLEIKYMDKAFKAGVEYGRWETDKEKKLYLEKADGLGQLAKGLSDGFAQISSEAARLQRILDDRELRHRIVGHVINYDTRIIVEEDPDEEGYYTYTYTILPM